MGNRVLTEKTPAGKGIRYNDGKSVFLYIATYRRVKRLAAKMGIAQNAVIDKAVKFYQDNGGSQAAAP